MYDIIIVGAGPAGLTAAVYARRAEKSVLIIEKSTFGGQITFSPKIENYPAFKEIGGNELADMMVDQALEMGAEIELGTVCEVSDCDGSKTVTTKEGDSYTARAVILATGAKHRMLGLEGEEALVGNGISFCAVCDGAFFKGQDVAVIGGGNSALQEAVLLSDTARSVTLVQNLDFFTGEAGLLEVLKKKSNVSFITGTTVQSFESEGGLLTGLKLSRVSDGTVSSLPVTGAFVAIGLAPDNGAFENVTLLDQWGYFDSDESCTTKTPGIFVAGDARKKKIRQITTATADGAVCALAACEYIDRG